MSAAASPAAAAGPAVPSRPPRRHQYVVCRGCPATETHRPGGVVWVGDEAVAVRSGRVMTCCAVCKGKAVDSSSGMCYSCGRVQVLHRCMLCVECKQRAPLVSALLPKPEDFFCEMEASGMCSEGDFIAQLTTCESQHQACAECFFLFLETQISKRELRWSYQKERFTVSCFGYVAAAGGVANPCPALLDDETCLKILPEAVRTKYSKFAVEKLTERLEGVICPLPRCSEAILDVPPVAQQKCVRCPYCTKFFCQKCKVEVEVLSMNGDMALAAGERDSDEEEDGDGGGGGGGAARDGAPPRPAAAGADGGPKAGGQKVDPSQRFRLLCKSCDLEWAGKDDATQALIKGSSKPCPFCEMPTTHYRGHACHHIRGCLNCKQHWCYMCGSRSRTKNEWAPSCDCASTGMCFCDMAGTCKCPICPDCRPGKRCPNCSGGSTCPSCNADHPEHAEAKKLWEMYYGAAV